MSNEVTVGRIEAVEWPEVDSFVLGIAENADGSGWSLTFAAPLNWDEQDSTIGHDDDYTISTHEGITCEGGIDSWHYDSETFTLTFDDKAVKDLGLSKNLVFAVSSQEDVDVLNSSLRRITRSG